MTRADGESQSCYIITLVHMSQGTLDLGDNWLGVSICQVIGGRILTLYGFGNQSVIVRMSDKSLSGLVLTER